LAEMVLKIFNQPEKYQEDPKQIARQFNPQANAAAYERLYQALLAELN